MSLFPRVSRNYPSSLPEHPDGEIFYVHAQEGTDSIFGGRGRRKEKPFATIAYAITQCSDDHNDIIYVTTSVQVEDQPVIINKRAVQVIGLSNNMPGLANQARTWMVPDAHVAGGVFTISAGDVVIKNFMLWGTAGQPCIDFGVEATGVRQLIQDCSFHVGSYGVMTGPAANQPSHYLGIVGCHFGPGLTTGGILHASNGSWPLIADCFFETIPGPNINVTGGMAGGRILNCLFMLDSDTEGEAITMGAAASRWWIVNNVANDNTTAAITANPFLEAGDDNAWIGNSKGGSAHTGIAPA